MTNSDMINKVRSIITLIVSDNRMEPVFYHKQYGYVLLTRHEMMKTHGISSTGISRLVLGKQKKAKG